MVKTTLRYGWMTLLMVSIILLVLTSESSARTRRRSGRRMHHSSKKHDLLNDESSGSREIHPRIDRSRKHPKARFIVLNTDYIMGDLLGISQEDEMDQEFTQLPDEEEETQKGKPSWKKYNNAPGTTQELKKKVVETAEKDVEVETDKKTVKDEGVEKSPGDTGDSDKNEGATTTEEKADNPTTTTTTTAKPLTNETASDDGNKTETSKGRSAFNININNVVQQKSSEEDFTDWKR